MATVSIYGAGQLGCGVREVLAHGGRFEVAGPFGRSERQRALAAGADVVVIATTTRLVDVVDDIVEAVTAGSNVLVSAEEAAYPWVVDEDAARAVHALALERDVTVAGVGVNPGLMFDSLVLTTLGALPPGCDVRVRRQVDLSGFGATVLRRIGIGHEEDAFARAVAAGAILGHAGFPQSMHVVASAVGRRIERIERSLLPLITPHPIELPGRFTVEAGEAGGVDQRYVAVVDGRPWYVAEFFGHVDLTATGHEPTDDIELSKDGSVLQALHLRPGVNAQIGSRHMVANSVSRVLQARSGWLTVAELPPAHPS